MNSRLFEEKSGEVMVEVLHPTGLVVPESISPATRLDSLEGKTIGLVWNAKPNANILLDCVGEVLQERYPTVKTKTFRLSSGWTALLVEGELEDIAAEVDAVVYASGD